MPKKTSKKTSAPKNTSKAKPEVEENEENLSMSEDESDDMEDEESEEAAEAADNDSEEPRPVKVDGRTLRKERGKRQILFTCSYIKNNKAISQEVFVTVPPTKEDRFDQVKGREEALAAFRKEHDREPDDVKGPYYPQKGIQQAAKKRETISINVNKLPPFTGQRANAVHTDTKGIEWRVLMNYTVDPNQVFVFYDKPLHPEKYEGQKLIKPNPKALPLASLHEVQDM